MSDVAFRERVREALAAPQGGSLASRFPAPLVTAIVAGAEEPDAGRLDIALREVVAALQAVGVPRGRQFVLLGTLLPGAASELARTLRFALEVPVLVHDPSAAHFTAGHAEDGTAYELDDELREAEAVVVVGPARAGEDGQEGGVGLLCPGVVSVRTRAGWAAARSIAPGAAQAYALGVEQAFPVDLALLWDAGGVLAAGAGRERFRADSTFPNPAR